ncbi:putative small intestine sodium-dependent phosphate transport protein [Microbacterium sp. HM58-2]|nr:putative small intestine sodium-dependent phosphate transport protein [Microbacterium sp. HM58-2]
MLAGIALGLAAAILMHILGWPYLAWLFNRIPPATHPDCAPRFRTWHRGVEVSS